MFFWSRLRDDRRPSRFARPKTAQSAKTESVPGTIKLGRVDYPCILHNLTATSVNVEFVKDQAPEMPQFFSLKSQSERVFRRARLIWQHRKQAGVEFIVNAPPAGRP